MDEILNLIESVSEGFLLPTFVYRAITKIGLPDGWMICDFTSFSTVFQSYQDVGRMIMKCRMQWKSK